MNTLYEEKSLSKLLDCNSDTIRFAIVSDTHIGGKLESFEQYEKAYELISKHGIENIIHLGDFFEGYCNIKQWKLDIEKAIKYYPNIPDARTFIVSGFHDKYIYKNKQRKCMIDEVCKYRSDLINITSKAILNPGYLNVNSDIYTWENIRMLFRHWGKFETRAVSTNNDICLTFSGHYHEFKLFDRSSWNDLNSGEYVIHSPALRLNVVNTPAGFIIVEITEEFIDINPISLEKDKEIYVKQKIYRS